MAQVKWRDARVWKRKWTLERPRFAAKYSGIPTFLPAIQSKFVGPHYFGFVPVEIHTLKKFGSFKGNGNLTRSFVTSILWLLSLRSEHVGVHPLELEN